LRRSLGFPPPLTGRTSSRLEAACYHEFFQRYRVNDRDVSVDGYLRAMQAALGPR
jgi:hypothetical protein